MAIYLKILLLDFKIQAFKRVKSEDFCRKGSGRPTMAEATELLVAKVEASRSRVPSYDSPKKIQKKRLMKRVKISKT